MQNFQNSCVYSQVLSYWQTLKKSQTCGLWNKPRVPTRPINTSVVVSVSSFPCLDLLFRNDSVCLFGFRTLSGNLGSSVFKKAAATKNPPEGEVAEGCGQLFSLSSPQPGPDVMLSHLRTSAL